MATPTNQGKTAGDPYRWHVQQPVRWALIVEGGNRSLLQCYLASFLAAVEIRARVKVQKYPKGFSRFEIERQKIKVKRINE